MSNNQLIGVTVTMPKPLKKRAAQKAKSQQRSLSGLIRHLIEKDLDGEGSK